MDQELKDTLAQIQRQISGLSDEVHQAREENHQTRILLEKQHDSVRLLAEGVIGTNERLDSFRAEMSIQLDQLKSFISLPYKDLDGRVKVLESWKERSERDPVEIVRERFGSSKA
jgi:regulator of replication initiation timing